MNDYKMIKLSFILISILQFMKITCNDQDTNAKYAYPWSDPWPETWVEPESHQKPGLSNDECVRRIYRGCNYPTTFSDEELEDVRQFLNYSFIVLADIKPEKPLCPKIHVRQDWKCLTKQRKNRLINIWKQMYRNGVIKGLTDLHVRTWPEWHKTPALLPTHRWFCNEFEKAMQEIDPNTTLPYWDPNPVGCQPERASIWETIGRSGNYSNLYVVEDGIYGELNLMPPIRRHWSPRNTIYPWNTPEYVTMSIQTGRSFTHLSQKTLNDHFLVHLNVGGYEGQYAVHTAPYDLLFYFHHVSRMDNVFLRFQFLNRTHLTPLDYSTGIRFNPISGNVEMADIRTDSIPGVPQITIRENFMLGFGDLCYITDQLVKPIVDMWRNRPSPVPTAAKRLPNWIIRKYFPQFLSGNFNGLTHTFEEVGNCNTMCLPLPKPTFLEETEIGRIQLEQYRYDNGNDQGGRFALSEHIHYKFWLNLNRAQYCSPYVTTY